MRDEFRKTKDYIRGLGRVNSCCMDIFNGMLANNDELAETMLRECENTIESLYTMDEGVKPGVWPVVIQELLDSVEYSDQLQSVYNKWITIVSDGVRIYSEKELNWLLSVKHISKDGIEPDSYINRCCRLLTQNRNLMYALWCNIQDLKLEYDLHDTDDYNLSLAFKAFYNVTEYPNGPEEIAPTDSCVAIPNQVLNVFPSKDRCEQYFNAEGNMTPTMWGKRFKKFAKPSKDWEKGDRKNVFLHLLTLYPDISKESYSTFQKATI